MKRMTQICTALTLAVTALPALSSATTLKLHHDMAEDSAQHEGVVLFKSLVEERTGGAVTVEIYANNALGDDVEVAQQMQFGAVHAAPIPTAKLTGFARNLGVVDLPFLFPNREIAYDFMDGDVGLEILSGLREAGFESAMFWESGFKQFTCNHAVNGPDDFEGRKVRVMESPLLIAQFEAMDALPTPIAFTETYTALQQGVVECQENPLVSIANMKFHEVQDFLMLSNHGYLGTAFIFSKVWFDALPADQQTILREAAIEAGGYQRERSIAREQAYLDAIVAAGGTEVITITPEAMSDFAAAMAPVYDSFGASLGNDLVARSLAEIDALSGR